MSTPRRAEAAAARAPAPSTAALERRIVERTAALERSEKRWRSFVATVPDVIAIVETDATIRYVNRDLAGHSRDCLIGTSLCARVEPHDCVRVREAIQRALSENQVQDCDVSLVSAEGDPRHFTMRVGPYRLDEPPDGAIVVMTCITRQRRAEASVIRAARLASVGTLAAGIAHEINNPLGSIMMAADLALASRNDPDGDATMVDSMRAIKEDAMRAGRIVRSVLQFSRHEESQKWPCSAEPLAARARDLTRIRAVDAGVVVNVETAGSLPLAWMNPTEIEQVLVNLIHNAIDATVAAGRSDAVTLSIASDKTHIVVSVRDRGEGIPAEHTGRIFDPFYTGRAEAGGTGLGLSVVHGIVRQHRGAIHVDTRAGVGTTIAVRIPRERLSETDL